MSSYLKNLVKSKIVELGEDKATEFFGVSKLLIQQWIKGSKVPSFAAVEKLFDGPAATADGTTAPANWEGRQVSILLPFYKHVHPVTTFSLLGLLDRTKMGALMRHNDAFIVHARNVLAKQFLDTGVEWAFWADDDMVFPWGHAAWYNQMTGFNLPEKYAGKHILNALMSHGKSLVGGLYFGRNSTGRAMYYEAMLNSSEGAQENLRAHKAPFDELKPVRWCATGALLTNRQVFLDIQKKFPHLAPQHPTEPWHFFSNSNDAVVSKLTSLQDQVGIAHQDVRAGTMTVPKMESFLEDVRVQLAETKVKDIQISRLQQGEDQTFGIRAGEAGHQSYVDMSVVVGHIGNTCFGPHNTVGK
jgi:hypothetical protein